VKIMASQLGGASLLCALSGMGCESPRQQRGEPLAVRPIVDASPSANPALEAGSPDPSTPDAAAPPLPESAFCRRIREARAKLLEPYEKSDAGVPPDIPDVLGACAGNVQSRWALSLDSVHYGPRPDGKRELAVGWSLVHDGATEVRVRPAAPPPFTSEDRMPDTTPAQVNLRADALDGTSIDEPVLFDWDGDGELEIAILQKTVRHEAGHWNHGRVWTFRNGAIALYPPVREFSIHKVEDVDGDHRPDLFTFGPYTGYAHLQGSGFEFSMNGPPLLLHAREGGRFSIDDAQATATARHSCAEATGATGPLSTGSQAEGTVRVVCARIYGVPANQVSARIDRECKGLTADLNSACSSAATWKQFARAVPPLRIVPHGP
jgi:hypothetical protein